MEDTHKTVKIELDEMEFLTIREALKLIMEKKTQLSIQESIRKKFRIGEFTPTGK